MLVVLAAVRPTVRRQRRRPLKLFGISKFFSECRDCDEINVRFIKCFSKARGGGKDAIEDSDDIEERCY